MSDAHFFNPKLFLSPLLWGKTELGESAHCILDWILSVRCFVLHKIRHNITVKNHLRVWRIYVWKFLNYFVSQKKCKVQSSKKQPYLSQILWQDFWKKIKARKSFKRGGENSQNFGTGKFRFSYINSVALEENHSLKEPDLEIIFWAKTLFFTVQDFAGF